jgi:quercetin dioxygenase-like cupin family protein
MPRNLVGAVAVPLTFEGVSAPFVLRLEMEPGAAIPEHIHKGPGMRYVLEGAIAIAWKNGKTETFKAGSTYFEAPGSDHPIGQMSARNAVDGRTRVLIFEILPKQ